MTHSPRYKLSVCVVTYNQEDYVAQCLQSLVDQQTDFPFEVLVADDCSTDNTRAVIQQFADRYPSIVRPIFQEKNLGAYLNFRIVHEQAVGEYVAHMDGDDYALPGKFQLQVDFLDAHPKCNMVFHRMRIMNQRSGAMVDDAIDLSRFHRSTFGRGDLLRYITLGMHSSKMYRAAVRDFPRPPFPVIDFFINVEQIGSGEAAFVGTAPLGVYRAGIGIASSGNGTRVLLKKSMLYFAEKYPQFRPEISIAAMVVFVAALKNLNWTLCRLYGAVLLKTLTWTTLREVWRDRHIIPMLIIPKAVR
jgi:glycosyltransferase involved in cell wall biosynthesis